MSPSAPPRALFLVALACALAACTGTPRRIGHQVADAARGTPDGGSVAAAPAKAPGRPQAEAHAAAARYALPGFAVIGDDGRLWVFKAGSAGHEAFVEKGEPAKRVTQIGTGPDGTTLLGDDGQVLSDFADSWRYAAPGYVAIGDDGRLWVFRAGSSDLADFERQGEPAKRVTLIGSGPAGKTLLGSDRAVLEGYLAAIRGR